MGSSRMRASCATRSFARCSALRRPSTSPSTQNPGLRRLLDQVARRPQFKAASGPGSRQRPGATERSSMRALARPWSILSSATALSTRRRQLPSTVAASTGSTPLQGRTASTARPTTTPTSRRPAARVARTRSPLGLASRGCRVGTEGGMRAEAYEGGNDLLRGHRAEHVKGPPGAKRQSVFLYAILSGDPYWRNA